MTAVEHNSIMHQFHGTNCSIDTTKRRLRQNNLYGRRPVKKPLVSARNLRTRIKFARDHLSWTVNDWSKVLFSNESKFMLFSSDGIRYVRRPIGDRFNPKYQLPIVKHGGGNVMVWGCFSRDNLGPIHPIEGTMDQRVSLGIMKNIMLPHAKDKMNRNWIFQQDNDPKDCARSVKEYFQSKKVNVLEWPSQSPDLKPIEHLWEYIDNQLVDRKPTNKDNLFGLIKECWYNIHQDVLINLVDSMPRRCDAVLKANGYATKY